MFVCLENFVVKLIDVKIDARGFHVVNHRSCDLFEAFCLPDLMLEYPFCY